MDSLIFCVITFMAKNYIRAFPINSKKLHSWNLEQSVTLLQPLLSDPKFVLDNYFNFKTKILLYKLVSFFFSFD